MELASNTANKRNATGRPTTESKRIPGEAGIWVLVLGDTFVFVLLFVSYLAYRSQDSSLFNTSQTELNSHYGALNTLLLLASSWLVVSALRVLRRGLDKLAIRLFQLAWFCGISFSAVKIVEYSEKLEQGITPLTNSFFMFYFVLTGLHFVHLIIGLGVLAYMISMLKKKTAGLHRLNTLESGATYWHLVDLLWVVLFPLIYLVR